MHALNCEDSHPAVALCRGYSRDLLFGLPLQGPSTHSTVETEREQEPEQSREHNCEQKYGVAFGLWHEEGSPVCDKVCTHHARPYNHL